MSFLSRRLKQFTGAALLGAGLFAFGAMPARAQDAKPRINAVLNAASFTQDIGQGSLASAFGNDFVDASKVNPVDYSCRPTWNDPTRPFTFPTSLCGVSVEADGQRLPLTYVGKQAGYDQVNFQAPFDVTARNIRIVRDGTASDAVKIDIKDKAPGIFTYGNHFAVAQNADYKLIGPTSPVRIPTSNETVGLDSWVAFYIQGMGKPIDAPTPALGALYPSMSVAHTEKPTVYIDGEQLADDLVVNASGAPGLIIQQLNWRPPVGMSAGAKTVKACFGDICSAPVNISMTDSDDYGFGTITSPGAMSDGEHALDAYSITLGERTSKPDAFGNYLIPGKDTLELKLAGNGVWENYKDSITINGKTNLGTIKGFPRVTYKDVTGKYNRENRTWDLSTGNPTAFDMVHYLATNGTSPECMETVNMWERKNQPIRIYLNPENQPKFDKSTGVNVEIVPSMNTITGTEVLWNELEASPSRGGPTFQRIDHDPLAAGEQGINFRFSDDMPQGWGGSTAIFPYSANRTACSPITGAATLIRPKAGTSTGLAATGRHELLGRGAGYGSSMTGILSPFRNDNMAGNVNDSARDLDGRKMVEFLGYGVDLAKYGR